MLDTYKLAFKAYDIRWIYGQEIDERFCYIMWKAIGKHMLKEFWKKWKMLIWSDVRDPNPLLINIFEAWMKDSWFDNVTYAVFRWKKVSDEKYPYWICSTSALYYLWHNDFDLCLSVTASHNPAEYVGMKFFYRNMELLSTDFLWNIFQKDYTKEVRIPQLSFNPNDLPKSLKEKQIDMYHFLLKKWNTLKQKHMFVTDFSSGAWVTVEKQFFQEKLAGKQDVLIMNDIPDGKFSNHLSDTQDIHNYAWVIRRIEEKKAEFGVMFDGDADRIGIVWPDGKVVWWDIVVAIIAKQILEENKDLPKSKKIILYEVMSSKVIPEIVAKFGWEALLVRVWRYFINKDLKEHKWLFAWESSGHFLFPEIWYCEMPLLALYYVIKELEESWSFENMIAKYLKYFKCPIASIVVEDKEVVLKNIKKQYAKFEQKTIDGISVFGKDFWFNVRPSNTENKIKFTVEADSEERMQEEREKLENIIMMQ